MKKIIILLLIFIFISSCQKDFVFNEKEQNKLINEVLYFDLFNKEQEKIILYQLKLKTPELELLEYDYEKEKEFLNSDISVIDSIPLIDNTQIIPPESPRNYSKTEWSKEIVSNYTLFKNLDTTKSRSKFLFGISNPIYNPRNKIALIETIRERIDGWGCHIDVKSFLYKRENNKWISLKKEGSYNHYLTLYDYYHKQYLNSTNK